MAFQLDTTGRVLMAVSEAFETYYEWSDLSPFTQGYIEALFAALMVPGPDGPEPLLFPAFSDLAPETLARIIADCESSGGTWAEGGRSFWKMRQAGKRVGEGFPPLTVQLGDDGKVRFADPARSSEGEGAR